MKGDEVFLTHLMRENDLIVSTSPLPPRLDLRIRRINAHIIELIGGFKDLLADEQAEELERDLHRILSSITSNKISCTIVLRNFDEQSFFSFYLVSLLSQVPTMEIEDIDLQWIKGSKGKERLLTYRLCPFGSKAEIRYLDEKELTKAYAILLASCRFPVYPRILAKSWSRPERIEAERRRVSKILSKLEEQGFIERKEQYVDYFGKGKVRSTSVPINAYKTTIKGRLALVSIGDAEKEDASILAERVSEVIEQRNILPKDIWVEDVIPFCPVYDEGLRNRLIISSNGRYAVPVKPEYLNPEWHNCSFIFVDIKKQSFELDKKEIINLLSKLGRMDVDDLRTIFDRKRKVGISGSLAFPMSARPWLDEPEEIGGPLKELVDRLGCVFNPCPFLHDEVCLVQAPVSQWGFEPNETQKKIYDLYELKKKYNF